MWSLLLLPLYHHCLHSGTRSSRDSVSCGWNILSPGFCTCCLLCPQCPPEAPLLQRPTCLPFKAQPHCPALFLECSFLLLSLEGLMPPGAGHPCAGPPPSSGATPSFSGSHTAQLYISLPGFRYLEGTGYLDQALYLPSPMRPLAPFFKDKELWLRGANGWV